MSKKAMIKCPTRDLDVDYYYTAYTSALSNILSTNTTGVIYAQIIDGMPTADTWYGYTNRRHGLIENHLELCQGSLETAKEFQTKLL